MRVAHSAVVLQYCAKHATSSLSFSFSLSLTPLTHCVRKWHSILARSGSGSDCGSMLKQTDFLDNIFVHDMACVVYEGGQWGNSSRKAAGRHLAICDDEAAVAAKAMPIAPAPSGGWRLGWPIHTHTHTKCPFIQRDAAELLQWYTDLCTAYTTVIAFWRQSAGHGQATIQQRLEQDQSSSNDRETESERERERACQHRRLFSNPLYFFFFFVMCHFIIIIIIVISVDVVCIIALKFGDALYVLCVA